MWQLMVGMSVFIVYKWCIKPPPVLKVEDDYGHFIYIE